MIDIPATRPLQPDTRGVLASRFFAYLIDAVIIALLTAMLFVFVSVLGFLTLGLAWMLLPLLAGTGVLYSMFTVGGSEQSTIGMRWLGLRVIGPEGARVDMLVAAIHAIFFYIALGTFILLAINVITGLLRPDRRMLHDLLTGVTVVRA